MIKQRTIQKSVQTSGVGLHNGEKVTMTLKPAEADQGIVFRRVDQKKSNEIKVSPDAVKDTKMCSAIGQDTSRVATVEHLMSALSATGIDNIIIELNGPEVPIMDGSSIPFIYLLQTAKLKELDAAKKFVLIKDVIEVKDKDKWARFEPYDGFKIDFTIDFPHPVFDTSTNKVALDFYDESYITEISRARTFGFMQEVEYLRSNGLARGGSLDNAIVLDEYKIINTDGLRYNDEFVRHKILDAVGDLYMLGYSIIGNFKAYKSGHELNNKLLLALLSNKKCWSLTTLDSQDPKTSNLAMRYANSKNGILNQEMVGVYQ
ncbi:UDP-3-O-acyl-N-acetylglucosamine deacetylase [Candidatus Methylopumilus universalis]|jgi:UDP-3-O-[3-hydroxymyristoyl] N-acetylglucosamine deacetylase|uniref:UDP-3-O-acyl-N-acetylglucosamine deacetylase n=1 Tax=Candidatus Methylopumilus universalis TaxID=2588536 RepID=A0AAX1F0I3_9PROT|nr:UDP-3-O-acyl-N-acetylglucosamine deacetylase [Candidatus Methylopumilus universalis]QDC41482.1 UDP-3-O-acyl-N-acetylglucosamine deacetylase [Candidatus Methylopumilus universalis]QDC42764.1 UDP-3-O-acyl-N-acetylglucosamine deacetylase [Candidatus Methylopumilus universalis]QDC55152.1 UDP-3-O-acyl-N-acetylglucosamine deacetylase [Candidatus Methylopumilus universalis]QDC56432.1 UDP-3-O-acyl-N-acetylglucosamine deacetylase [Candidatus Methylopumilus universalis]QDC57722.1 UDP-3-O-acyl-N-acety